MPAPRSPTSVTVMPPANAGASAAPAASVAAASGRRIVSGGVNRGFAECVSGGSDGSAGRRLIGVGAASCTLTRWPIRSAPPRPQPPPGPDRNRQRSTGRRWPTAITGWGRDLGFAEIGISDTDLSTEEARLVAWLDAGRHGRMDYMARHGVTRARPAALVPGTLRVISARMDYLPPGARDAAAVLADPELGYVARYALGRDYHKVCATGCNASPRASATRSATSAIGSSPTARRSSRSRWRRRPGSAGGASTRCC